MIGLAFALIAVGLIVLLIVPWVGIVVAVAGLVLLVAQLIARRRRPAASP
jgi:hypothetical protein